MAETSQTVTEDPRPKRGRATRAVPGIAAAAMALVVVAVLVLSAAGPGLGLFAKASPTPSGRVGATGSGAPGASASAMPGAEDDVLSTVPPLLAPAETAPVGIPVPTTECLPGPNGGCAQVAAPTREPSGSHGPELSFTVHVPILEYHRVKPAAGETGYAVDLITPPELFEAQMAAMSTAGWHTITMGELGDDLQQGIQPSARSFVVTFDDGYEDGYTYAYPILRRYGFVATYFVIGSRIGDTDSLTVSELQALLAASCEIGNHTMDHVDLVALTAQNQAREIYDNSALIARDIGVWPQSFSYPAGFTDESVIAAVAATPALETAVVQQSSKPENWANRWQLPRIRVGPGTYPQDLVDKATRYVS
ncbi:MAG TPA: polysaccharide deacetylase family protein [Candidatus Limnocylindrales bacterium]